MLTHQCCVMTWILGIGFVKYFQIHSTVSEQCAFAEKNEVMKLFSVWEELRHIVPVLIQ